MYAAHKTRSSQYFDSNKVSMHVTILYRHASLQTDGKESTEDNPSIIKEHLFAISDENTEDYLFVHHVQSLILRYLREQQHLTVDKIHEFTDGCAGQYKSKHTFGDLSCCLADFGSQIDRHFFVTSHAKGEQDTAGANVKQRATLAVLQRKVTIGCAKDLYDYLVENFQQPTSSSGGITLKKRVYFYIPAEGEGCIQCNRPGRKFKEVKGIRKIHSIQTTPTQCKISTRQRSCVCDECLLGNSNSCLNSEFVDKWQGIEMSRDGQVAVARQHQDTTENERVNGIADLVEAGSIVAIAAADDTCYDYYLLKVSSPGAVQLSSDTIDGYDAAYQKDSFILEGNFFLRENIMDMAYKLDEKKAIVYANTVQAICGELAKIRKQRKELFKVSFAQHEEIMSVF